MSDDHIGVKINGIIYVKLDDVKPMRAHIEKLEAALRTVKEWHGYGLPLETTRMIDAALEGKDD